MEGRDGQYRPASERISAVDDFGAGLNRLSLWQVYWLGLHYTTRACTLPEARSEQSRGKFVQIQTSGRLLEVEVKNCGL